MKALHDVETKRGIWTSSKLWQSIKAAFASVSHIVVYDLETTGLSAKNHRIIEIAAIRYKVQGLRLVEEDTLHRFINPGCVLIDNKPTQIVLSEKIVALTGITNAFLSDKPTEDALFGEIAAFFDGMAISGYNAPFDQRFMEEMYARYGSWFSPPAVIDVLKMARELIPKEAVPDHKLETIGRNCGISFRAHSALDDTRATAELLIHFLKEYRKAERDAAGEAPETVRPLIRRIEFWPGRRGRTRIYVETDMGTVYYDPILHRWGAATGELSVLDMEWLENESWRLAGCATEEAFCRFNDVLNIA